MSSLLHPNYVILAIIIALSLAYVVTCIGKLKELKAEFRDNHALLDIQSSTFVVDAVINRSAHTGKSTDVIVNMAIVVIIAIVSIFALV